MAGGTDHHHGSSWDGDGRNWNRRAVGKEKEKKKGEEVVLFGRGGSGGVAESRERAC